MTSQTLTRFENRDEAQQLALSERAGNEDVGLERTELLIMQESGPTRFTDTRNYNDQRSQQNDSNAEDPDDEEIAEVISSVLLFANI